MPSMAEGWPSAAGACLLPQEACQPSSPGPVPSTSPTHRSLSDSSHADGSGSRETPTEFNGEGKSGGRGGGRGQEKKRLAVLEKNRRNQKKFRERQKVKMAGLEHSVHELTTEVNRLTLKNYSLEKQNTVLSRVLHLKEGQIKVLSKDNKGELEGEETALSYRAVKCPESPLLKKLVASKVKKMSLQDMCRIYAENVHRLSDLLVTRDAYGPSPELEQSIHDKVMEMGELLGKHNLLRPNSSMLFAKFNYELGVPVQPEDLPETDAQRSAETLLRSMAMSDEQIKIVLALNIYFRSRVIPCRERQRQLARELEDYVRTDDLQTAKTDGAAEAPRTMEQILTEMREAMEYERIQYVNYCYSFFGTVCNDVQCARMYVHSFPYHPDVLGVVLLVNAEAKRRGLSLDPQD